MAATTTPSMPWLIQQLKTAHPTLTFVEAERFSWSPTTRTIHFNPSLSHAEALLLHELSHALLAHHTYRRDIELVAMETAAWDQAVTYCREHPERVGAMKITMDDDVVQDHLDTYRDWLHHRSVCPHCSANGYQTDKHTYSCPACLGSWRVNEARLCALRRYRL